MNVVGPLVGALVGPTVEVLKQFYGPLGQRIDEFRSIRKNLQLLKENARELFNRKADIEQELERNSIRKAPTKECESWLQRVKELSNEINAIEEEDSKDMKCCGGWLPDVKSRTSLGKRIKLVINLVSELKDKANFDGGVCIDVPLRPAHGIQLIEAGEETSLQFTIKEVLGRLGDGGICKVGIWGMGGIGKTTLMKALNNFPDISKEFGIVLWVTVSKSINVRNMQKQVAEQLHMRLGYTDSNETVAREIFHKLKSVKFLLLLDDVWQRIDLSTIGIPIPSAENGCKVILTTRFLSVCNQMETDAEVKVAVLSKKEAWDLFCLKAGNVVHSKGITPIAKAVADECGGLPLAIVVLGRALRKNHDAHVWQNALRELRSPSSSNIEEMEYHVFKPLSFSYDQLGDEFTKKCFLYCALYPEDYKIECDQLIEYWRAEGLLGNTRGVREVYGKGRAILSTLVQSSLLESIQDEKFMMHDLIRDLALRITSTKAGNSSNFFVTAGLGNVSQPTAEQWSAAERVSMMCTQLVCLAGAPSCPMVSTLLIRENKYLEIISDIFFKKMEKVRVLDLSKTGISSLPPSISSMACLRGLYLNNCYKLDILPPEIGFLKELETLQVRDTGITDLPVEIGNLSNLICLNVSTHRRTNKENRAKKPLVFGNRSKCESSISWEVISKLLSLEDLAIDVDMGSQWWSRNISSVFEAVAGLKNLTKVELHFPNIGHLLHFLTRCSSWKKNRLLSFEFSVSPFEFLDYHVYGHRKNREFSCGSLRFTGNQLSQISPALVDIVRRSKALELKKDGFISSLSEFGLENVTGLKELLISNCPAFEILANGENSGVDILPNLEELTLNKMARLRNIVEGSISHGSFKNLKHLCLRNCHQLKYVFPRSGIRQISNLVSMDIAFCHQLEDFFQEHEIVPEETVRHEFCELPNFRLLDLYDVKIVSLAKIVTMALSTIQDVSFAFTRIRTLPESLLSAPRLRKLSVRRKCWDAIQWPDDETKERFQRLHCEY